jgi:phosphoenolpyruvate-protein phosphotransferase
MNLAGQGVSPGVAVGPALLWRTTARIVPQRTILLEQIEAELARLTTAIDVTRSELKSLTAALRQDVSAEVAAIFEAHAEMLDDPELIGEVNEQIRSVQVNAEHALSDVVGRYTAALRDLEDEYMRQRATDLEDVAQRVLRHLEGGGENVTIDQPSIIIADDLTPSDTAQFPPGMVLGFATASGGATSHTAILARALGIPAIVGIGDQLWQIDAASTITLDGSSGVLDTTPSADEIAQFKQRHLAQQQQRAGARQAAQAPAITLDGQHIEVLANIAQPNACDDALGWGAEGVGLFRTEFLFLDRKQPPTEQEQYEAYAHVLRAMQGRRCLIRTADIGGDKGVPYLTIDDEANPFLGWRGTRLLWGMEALLRTQLRALLRASVHGPVGIMFPMIAGPEDFRAAKALLQSVRHELQAANIPLGDVSIGVMIEVPSAALCAGQLARECDFFSIGTNDLAQYTLACDRTNPRVAHLLDPLHPAVLQLIAHTIKAGHNAGIHVGMCGELAADPTATPILLGLGLQEFSASPSAIPALKRQINQISIAQAIQIANAVLELTTAHEIREHVTSASSLPMELPATAYG